MVRPAARHRRHRRPGLRGVARSSDTGNIHCRRVGVQSVRRSCTGRRRLGVESARRTARGGRRFGDGGAGHAGALGSPAGVPTLAR